MLVIITDRGALGTALSEELTARGVFLYRCPMETGLFVCDQKDTGGVLLDCVPNLSKGERLCHELRKRYPEIPIAAIVPPDSCPDLEADCILREESHKGLIHLIWTFYCDTCGWRSTPMTSYHLTVGDTPEETVYMGYSLPLSPTEHAILRCVFYRSPHPTSNDDLMTLCFPGGGQKIGNLAVHIRNINQKASRIDPRPLIENVYGKGYRLRGGLI